MQAAQSTIDATEVAKFEAMAAEWWDPNGKFKPASHAEPLQAGLYHVADRSGIRA